MHYPCFDPWPRICIRECDYHLFGWAGMHTDGEIFSSSKFVSPGIPATRLTMYAASSLRAKVRAMFNLPRLFVALALIAFPASAAPALRYQWSAGDKLIYKIDYRSNSELNFGGLVKGKAGPTRGYGANDDNASAPAKIKVTIKGDLVETVLASKDSATTVGLLLESSKVKFITEGENDESQATALAQGLGHTIFATLDAQGHVTELRFDDGTTPEAQLAARAIIALLQFVLPEGDQTPKSWQTKEQEPNGDYTARYTQAGKGKGGGALVKKQKLKFAEEAEAVGPHEISVKKQIKPKGSFTAQFDNAKGRLAGITGQETQTVLLNGRAVGKAEVTLKFSLNNASKIAGQELKGLAGRAGAGKAVALKSVEDKKAAEAAIQQNELKGQSADELFAELQKLEESGGDEQPVYLKLKALFFVKPESAARAGELLSKAKSHGVTVRVLSGALGTVGNPQSQAALAAAAKARPKDDPALAAILPAMGELAQPQLVAEEALRALALAPGEGDGSSTARLALGTMAATAAKGQPDRAGKIVADLMAMLEKNPGEEVSRQILLALGNSTSPEALPALKKALADKSNIIREAAAKALGQNRSPEAEALLKTAAGDPDEHVKKAAEDGLSNHKSKN